MMKFVVDRYVETPNRYKLTNADTGEVLGTFDFDEVTGSVVEEGTVVDAELLNAYKEAIEAEISRAKAAELANTTAIGQEAERAQKAEEAANKAVETEAARAQAAEKANTSAIDAEKTRATGAENKLQTAIEAEATRATIAEQANAKAISNEITRAKAAEGANTTAINEEITRATAAEKKNADSLTSEQTRAMEAETTLNGKIDTEIADRKAAITAEETARTTALQQVEKDLDSRKANKSDLADVATSGSYEDLVDKPTIPSSLPPSGAAGGDLTGTYPNPTIADDKVTKAKLDSAVRTSLEKADTALQSHQSLANYYTKTETDNKISTAISNAITTVLNTPV